MAQPPKRAGCFLMAADSRLLASWLSERLTIAAGTEMNCLTILPWSMSCSRTPSRSFSFWTIHDAWVTNCAEMSVVAKCSSKAMNGGRGRDRGSTAPVDTPKKLNNRLNKVMTTIVVFEFYAETPSDCQKARNVQREDDVKRGGWDSYRLSTSRK